MLITGEVQILATVLMLWPLISTAASPLIPGLFLVLAATWALQTRSFYLGLRKRVEALRPVSWADMKGKGISIEEFFQGFVTHGYAVLVYVILLPPIPTILIPPWWLSANPEARGASPAFALWVVVVGLVTLLGGGLRMRELGGCRPGSRAGLAREPTVLLWPLLAPSAAFLSVTFMASLFSRIPEPPPMWLGLLASSTGLIAGLVGVALTLRLIAWTSGLDKDV